MHYSQNKLKEGSTQEGANNSDSFTADWDVTSTVIQQLCIILMLF